MKSKILVIIVFLFTIGLKELKAIDSSAAVRRAVITSTALTAIGSLITNAKLLHVLGGMKSHCDAEDSRCRKIGQDCDSKECDFFRKYLDLLYVSSIIGVVSSTFHVFFSLTFWIGAGVSITLLMTTLPPQIIGNNQLQSGLNQNNETETQSIRDEIKANDIPDWTISSLVLMPTSAVLSFLAVRFFL